MRVIIAGSRTINDYGLVCRAIINSGLAITEVVWGKHWQGVDPLAKRWADEHSLPATAFPADWGRWGRAAGPMRNGQMARYAQALIAVWDGVSAGTVDMVEQACRRRLLVYVSRLEGRETHDR